MDAAITASYGNVQRLTGIPDSTVAYLENGRHKPRPETLRRLLGLYRSNIREWERRERVWETAK